MRIKRVKSSQKKDVVEIFKVCFDYSGAQDALYLEDESIWDFVWGMEDNRTLIATYISSPTKTRIRGREFDGHYIDGVATMPFYRKGGLARRLFLHDAKHCMRKGVEILLLDPFKHDFYRQMGFEVAFDNNDLEFDFALLATSSETELSVVNGTLYQNNSLKQQVRQALEKSWHESRYSEAIDIPAYSNAIFRQKELRAAVATDSDGNIRGYMLYKARDRKMTIPRFWFLDISGFQALKVFLSRHKEQIDTFHMSRIPPDFPVDLLLHSAWQGGTSMQLRDRPSRMLRILDAVTCLKKVVKKGCTRSVTLRVVDPVIRKNNLNIELSSNGAKASEEDADLWISISDLAPLLTGRLDAVSLWRMGRIRDVDDGPVGWHTQDIPRSLHALSELLPAIPTHSAR